MSAATVYLTADLEADPESTDGTSDAPPMARLIRALSSVGCLNISVRYRYPAGPLALDARTTKLEAGARRLAASLPWATIRRVQIECSWTAETVALLRAVEAPVVGLHCSSGSLSKLAEVLSALREGEDRHKHKLDRLERLHVDGDWGSNLGLVEAMPTIAALPPRCALSVPATLCHSPLAVQLLRTVLSPSPEGGRRARVDVFYGSDDALKRLHVHAAVACVSSRAGDIVTVDADGRELDPQPDRDREAALRRLRALSPAGAFVATAWKGASPL